jgi:hypothetical protein
VTRHPPWPPSQDRGQRPLLSTFIFVHFGILDMEWTKVDIFYKSVPLHVLDDAEHFKNFKKTIFSKKIEIFLSLGKKF